MVENEIDLKVKTLQSDNRGEYVNAEFQIYCDKNGIKMRSTMSENPQQNGVAKRMNRTLNKQARSLRLRLPQIF